MTMKQKTIILVDDDKDLLEVYKKILTLKGFNIVTFCCGEDALEYVKKHRVTVAILDVIMPKMSGMELLIEIKKSQPETEVIMLTAEGSISGAVDAVKKGAFSYLVKPADIEELISNVKKAEELSIVKDENNDLKEQIATITSENRLIGISPVAEELRRKAAYIGETDSTVMITGETGVGKEVVARLIHEKSRRADKPFICVNCGALNENLIESELFGSEKGAYTGSERLRKGRFELADGGTLFFDEIGELSLNMQVKLLRVLQEKSFERVGGSETLYSDFRLISATNRNLKKEVDENRFRADLYYRINIIPIDVPPLRERKADIPLLCSYFLNVLGNEMNKRIVSVEKDVQDALNQYSWPGNVRELRNIMERLIVLSRDGILDLGDLPEEIRLEDENTEHDTGLRDATKAFEKEYIERILRENDGNVTKAAKEMNIARKNLYKKMNDYGIKNI